jgi:protein TonB
MAQVAHVPHPAPDFMFRSLVVTRRTTATGRKSATFAISITAHALLVAAILIVPLLFYDALPQPGGAILTAFFVAPPDIAPPPPPPPPPAPAVRAAIKPPAPLPSAAPTAFVAPLETPAEIREEEGLDLGFGVEGGVPGGVEGGVPGGVLGGIVGGVMPEAPPPPRVVRVGGHVVAPKLLKRVQPVYPELAKNARVSAVIILEAQVDTRGYVKTVHVLRGHPLLDEYALAAVRQWRYQPLLLNGEPAEFILTVTVIFSIVQANAQ